MIDYLGICASCRIRQYTENSYTLVKAIAEELRALAVETETVVWSAAQVGRGAWDASDMNMSDIAESAGLPATADFMLAVIETEELAQMEQQLIKQIKSRYGDKNKNNKFSVGVKKGNQRWVEPDGESAPKIPAASDHEMEISNAAQNTQEHLNKVHRVQAASRSELEDLADQIKF